GVSLGTSGRLRGGSSILSKPAVTIARIGISFLCTESLSLISYSFECRENRPADRWDTQARSYPEWRSSDPLNSQAIAITIDAQPEASGTPNHYDGRAPGQNSTRTRPTNHQRK